MSWDNVNTGSLWTPERIELALRLWQGGRSGSQIAADLDCGLSRSAVLGKLWRLGQRQRLPRAQRVVVPKPSRRVRVTNVEMLERIEARKASPGPKLPPSPPPVVDATHAKPWTERAFGECAYPISEQDGETWSCCAPTKATYCKAHARVVYEPPKAPRTPAQAAFDARRRLKAIERFSEWAAA